MTSSSEGMVRLLRSILFLRYYVGVSVGYNCSH